MRAGGASHETLGLLQLHGPSADELDEPMLAALERLKARGIARAVGLNSFDPAVIAHAIGLPVIDVVMVDYNVLRPEREPLIARAAAAGKGVLAGMPLAMGHTRPLLARLKGPQNLWYAARALAKHRDELARGRRFRFLHGLAEMTGSQAALALEHLRANLAASGRSLPAHVTAQVRAAQS